MFSLFFSLLSPLSSRFGALRIIPDTHLSSLLLFACQRTRLVATLVVLEKILIASSPGLITSTVKTAINVNLIGDFNLYIIDAFPSIFYRFGLVFDPFIIQHGRRSCIVGKCYAFL